MALIDFDKVGLARTDYSLRVRKTVYVNRYPAAVHEDEVLIPDQPKMVFPISLDKELLRVPAKIEHFAMTRRELLLVYGRRLTCAPYIGLVRTRTCPTFIRVYLRSMTLNFCLSAHVCASLRFARLFLLGTHFLPFRWRSSLRLGRLPLGLRLLRLRLLA